MNAISSIGQMNEAEARRITDQINAKSNDLWQLLMEAQERKAWAALGYSNWRDYAVTEFSVSQSRAYQLLDQAKVVTAVRDAANSTMVEISERVARAVKPKLTEVVQKIKSKVAKGADPKKATFEVIEAVQVTSKKQSKILPRPQVAEKPKEDSRVAELTERLHDAEDNARELAESLEAYTIAEEGVEAAAKEIKRLQGQLRTVESQRDQYMTKCSELVKTVKALERKIAKLESGK